jgi:hypothetical protein
MVFFIPIHGRVLHRPMLPRIEISSGTHHRRFSRCRGKASATFPTESRSPAVPEPTTSASRNAVPTNSALTGLFRLNLIADRRCPGLSSTQGFLWRRAGDKGRGRFADQAERKHPGRLSALLPVCLRPLRDREHPQCAVIGWPGPTRPTSFAALSQTVKTKPSFAASVFANWS